jgi:hypothetical protein
LALGLGSTCLLVAILIPFCGAYRLIFRWTVYFHFVSLPHDVIEPSDETPIIGWAKPLYENQIQHMRIVLGGYRSYAFRIL